MLIENDQAVELLLTDIFPVMDGRLPCVCPDAAAVVRYAPALREMPELFTVHVAPVIAVFRPTKLVFAFDAIAVVR